MCLLLAACSVSEEEDPAPESDAAPAFSAQAEELCRPVTEAHEGFLEAENAREFEEAAAAVTRAEQELADDLRDVEVPPGTEEDLAAYVEALEEYSDAQASATGGTGPARRSLDDIVHAAKTGVRLHEAGERAGLPEVCPPPPTVDPFNTLFFARANRDCFEVRSKIGRSQVREVESTADILEFLGVARRVSAGVARALRRSTPGESSIRIRRMVSLAEKKLALVEATRKAVAARDLPAYERATEDLVRLHERLNKEMLEVGLISCVKTSTIAGFRP